MMTARRSPRRDLLVPGIGELIGGSQREEREDVLLSRLKELGLDPADYDFYIKLRRTAAPCIPVSGWVLSG